MSDFALLSCTRDAFLVEFDGAHYKVDGERGRDVWDVFPEMIYRCASDGSRHRVEDAALRRRIVDALVAHCAAGDFDWRLNVVRD